ncbi:hypothetical protein JTE90_005644 [Oedothorax gibbosus]|uniref:Uncharacterized protein n=1 Tax=Oedothorax gibbosus TaxID=931172 RepID=A0AAV6UFE1_9ARAC|nr:hypothetical protein JTE90_005644 [Oedothorax gibbosus]
MTPSSDYRKLSLMPDIVSYVTRSQSDTSYEGLLAKYNNRDRRPSEWTADPDRNQLVLRQLQVNEDNPAGLLYRRLSSKVKSGEGGTGVCRSYSMKSVKKLAEARQRNRGSSIPTETRHYGGKTKERSISNRSLPLPGEESDYCRLRNFSVTSKGVVNRGDSFRSRSGSCAPPSPPSPVVPDKKPFRVVIAGAQGVGKSAMWKQFMTSEYICADDCGNDREVDCVINVVLNNEESQMEFEEETLQEENACVVREECADAFVVVYSVTDRRSYAHARRVLAQVERLLDTRAVILVGNKTDLARLRAVTTEEGRSLAKERGCKFIETSVAINHQVDELLVGTLTQIRLIKAAHDKKKGGSRRSSFYAGGAKASGVLKKILRRACLSSKSCDNLHVL